MGKQIIGMILGTVLIIVALVYLTCVNLCVAIVAPHMLDVTVIDTSGANALASAVVAIGAIVLLANVALVTLGSIRPAKPKDAQPKAGSDDAAGGKPEDEPDSPSDTTP